MLYSYTHTCTCTHRHTHTTYTHMHMHTQLLQFYTPIVTLEHCRSKSVLLLLWFVRVFPAIIQFAIGTPLVMCSCAHLQRIWLGKM